MKKNQIRSASPIEYTLSTIGGKWKPNILFLIQLGINRFGLLHKGIHDISKQMLTKQLRELEKDGLITRKIFAEIPPRVEYFISAKGETMMPILETMVEWGQKNMTFDAEGEVDF
ncbi:MAG: helix-turn-helix transcriptional regulator [Bacteroidetes bacterium]|nr:helix-turn-helix transcriptional regulator [Bacteroidota bacterium]